MSISRKLERQLKKSRKLEFKNQFGPFRLICDSKIYRYLTDKNCDHNLNKYEQMVVRTFNKQSENDEARQGISVFFHAIEEFKKNGIHGMTLKDDFCQIMLRTDINIKSRDFSLPYSPFVINFPSQFSMDTKRKGGPYISNAVIQNDLKGIAVTLLSDTVLADLAGVKAFGEFNLATRRYGDNEYIEDKLNYESETYNETEWNSLLDFQRIVINSIIYLTVSDTEDREVKSRSYNPSSEPVKVTNHAFIHQIKIKKSSGTSTGEGKQGEPKKPHWRRGHWRKQYYGIGNEYVKLIFIQPVFVNPSQYSGDMVNTGANYKVTENVGKQ